MFKADVEEWLSNDERARFHATPSADCGVYFALAEVRHHLALSAWADDIIDDTEVAVPRDEDECPIVPTRDDTRALVLAMPRPMPKDHV